MPDVPKARAGSRVDGRTPPRRRYSVGALGPVAGHATGRGIVPRCTPSQSCRQYTVDAEPVTLRAQSTAGQRPTCTLGHGVMAMAIMAPSLRFDLAFYPPQMTAALIGMRPSRIRTRL